MSVLFLFSASNVWSSNLHIAAASNFTATMRSLQTTFEQRSGHSLTISYGSSGQLYTQIRNGAPFEVFLSADKFRPQKLSQDGYAVIESRFTYALGQIALWHAKKGSDINAQTLINAHIQKRLATANPKHAPYGVAAMETLKRLDVYDLWKKRIITGQNVAQAQQFIASGHVSLGFIAYSQILSLASEKQGSHWLVPTRYHSPLAQQLVVLKKGEANPLSFEFLEFLKSPEAQSIMQNFGYITP